jgi:hypothetical protein
MPTFLDPNRVRPRYRACYENGSTCDGQEHEDWRHAQSWDEVTEWLDAGADVRDRDGDLVTAYIPERNVTILEGGGEYNYQPEQMLLENVEITPPASPEEEDEALRSIMEAFNKNRLSGS